MNKMRTITVLALAASLAQGDLLACTACYGQSDSPMAAGMNWGIFSLLGIIGVVLLGVAGFGVFLARKAAAAAGSVAGTTPPSTPLPKEPIGT